MFDTNMLDYNEEELNVILDQILTELRPGKKSLSDFTGGYVQQLKHKTVAVFFFGYKGSNPDAIKITINPKEIDLYYLMIKAKTMSLTDDKVLNVSATEHLARLKHNKSDILQDGDDVF